MFLRKAQRVLKATSSIDNIVNTIFFIQQKIFVSTRDLAKLVGKLFPQNK